MKMDTKEYIKRKKKREKEERAKSSHIWLIEEYLFCTDKQTMVWEIAADEDGMYRIWYARKAARMCMKWEYELYQQCATGKIRRFRVRRFDRRNEK